MCYNRLLIVYYYTSMNKYGSSIIFMFYVVCKDMHIVVLIARQFIDLVTTVFLTQDKPCINEQSKFIYYT